MAKSLSRLPSVDEDEENPFAQVAPPSVELKAEGGAGAGAGGLRVRSENIPYPSSSSVSSSDHSKSVTKKRAQKEESGTHSQDTKRVKDKDSSHNRLHLVSTPIVTSTGNFSFSSENIAEKIGSAPSR